MSQLRITQFDENHLPVLNKWAREQSNQTDAHAKQLAQLQSAMQKLLEKNPNLVKP